MRSSTCKLPLLKGFAIVTMLLVLVCLILHVIALGDQLELYNGPYFISEVPSILPVENVTNVDYATMMTFRMPNVRADIINAIATIWYPLATKPPGGYRLIVVPNATVGTASHCATSLDSQTLTSGMATVINAILQRGYIVITLDMEGLGVSGSRHAYLNAQSEARSALYAVRAFKQQHDADFHGDWGVIGQSQAGHAALNIASYVPSIDSGLKVSVAAAPPSHVWHVTDNILPAALPDIILAEQYNMLPAGTAVGLLSDVLVFSTCLSVGLKASDPTFDYEAEVFEPTSAVIATLVEGDGSFSDGLCYKQARNAFRQSILNWLDENPTLNITSYPGLRAGVNQRPQIRQWFDDNEPDNNRIDVPVMIVQGTADQTVPIEITNWVVGNLTLLGTNVTYLVVPGGTHTSGFVQKVNEYLDFVEEHLPPYPEEDEEEEEEEEEGIPTHNSGVTFHNQYTLSNLITVVFVLSVVLLYFFANTKY